MFELPHRYFTMKKMISHEIVAADFSPLSVSFWKRLPEVFSREGITIYKGRNEIKIFQIEGRTVCVKKYGVPFWINRVLYSWGWRTPKAQRTYQNAQKILERGFDTPEQYGYVLVRKNGWLGEAYSVGAFVHNARTVAQDKTNKELVRAFARYTAQLHVAGLMHRDYILNNILYTYTDGQYHFTLIDINRFHFQNKPVREWPRCVNLMQPFPDWDELKFFVETYREFTKAGPLLYFRVMRLRCWRNRYSALKHLLKKLPGAKFFSPKPVR